jgi:hypothetical protein
MSKENNWPPPERHSVGQGKLFFLVLLLKFARHPFLHFKDHGAIIIDAKNSPCYYAFNDSCPCVDFDASAPAV